MHIRAHISQLPEIWVVEGHGQDEGGLGFGFLPDPRHSMLLTSPRPRFQKSEPKTQSGAGAEAGGVQIQAQPGRPCEALSQNKKEKGGVAQCKGPEFKSQCC